MRFIVMAAERAATMAARIHAIWRSVGQPCVVARAASSAPVSANGRAKTECSNLIISSTVRMRLCSRIRLRLGATSISFGRLYFECLAQGLPFPGELAVLRQSQLHQHAAAVLRQ